jgi:hypothetical protein
LSIQISAPTPHATTTQPAQAGKPAPPARLGKAAAARVRQALDALVDLSGLSRREIERRLSEEAVFAPGRLPPAPRPPGAQPAAGDLEDLRRRVDELGQELAELSAAVKRPGKSAGDDHPAVRPAAAAANSPSPPPAPPESPEPGAELP